MNLLKKLKKLFKKDLNKILAPLWNIYEELSAFLEHTSEEIINNTLKVNDLLAKNKEHAVAQNTAIKVQENVKQLLGE